MNAENGQEYFSEEVIESGFNIKVIISKLLEKWMWFVIGILLAFAISFLYLRYQIPIYQAKATVLIKDEKKGGSLSELSAFQDLNIMSNSNSLENEIEIFKSRSLMARVVKDLNLQTSYVAIGKVINKEIFNNLPFTIIFLNEKEVQDELSAKYKLKIVNETQYNLIDANGKNLNAHNFGDTVVTSKGKLVINNNKTIISHFLQQEFYIINSPVTSVVDKYLGAISVKPLSKVANLIEITLNDRSKEKAKSIINNLILQHNQDAIDDKNQISKNTANFINDRLQYITNELSSVESSAQQYKQNNNVVDVASEAKLYLQSDQANQQKVSEITSQQKIADYIYTSVIRNNNTELIPTNMGIADGSSANMINNYNQLILERNNLLKNAGEANPVVEALDGQINSLKQNLIAGISNYRASLQIQRSALASQGGLYNSKIAAVPRFERQIKSIDRQQQIKEGLYLYLLQKREETNIALAVTVANTKIIDSAYSNGVAISPDKKKIYTLALALGLLIPAFFVYLKNLLDTKVHSVKDLEKLNIPFVGDIPLAEFDNHLVITKGLSTSIAEAFRMARTNLDFITKNNKSGGKIILVTSTIPNEGKSFISLNLASTISLTNKKVLLVGLDLRAPKLAEYLNIPLQEGVTNYIIDDNIKLDDIIIKNSVSENIDVIISGDIPPNPSELLLDKKVIVMFETLRKMYDYIIIDTAPIGVVTDTILVSEYADATLYIVKADFLDKHMLNIPLGLHNENRLKNMAIILNGTKVAKGYGYGYGYGYGNYLSNKKSKSFNPIKKLFNKS